MASNEIAPESSVGNLPGIGPTYQKKLLKLGIETISDLLHHYPSRFLDYTKFTPANELKDKQTTSLSLVLDEPKQFTSRTGKLITSVTGSDDTGKITLIWFNSPYIGRLIKAGGKYIVAGKTSFLGEKLVIVAPTIEPAGQMSLHIHGLVPIYPLTEKITSRFLRTKIKQAFSLVSLSDPLESNNSLNFLSHHEALEKIHFPKDFTEQKSADRRLAFNYHLSASLINQLEKKSLPFSISIRADQLLHHRLAENLPFKLTKGQEKAIQASYKDLEKSGFTHRLIQGETGSGKTMVVFFLAAAALAAKKSICLLAPTKILANQHYQTFLKFGLPKEQTFLITGKKLLRQISGKPFIFIGTHALFGQIPEKLTHPLCAVVVDEQHRFGVKQRELLIKRSPLPHLFNLTATPIPRTLALGLFGEIEISTLTEKPKNRLPVRTWLMGRDRFAKSTTWLKDQLKSGSKVFAVAPVINETENKKEIDNVKELFSNYQTKLGNLASIFLIHGQMKSEEINHNLELFAKTKHAILIATSMIEVGVDIPEADVIIIHSASHFGLASLHQLRGRVGRREKQGYCLLIDDDEAENERLQLLTKYHSGLTLSKMDLKLRGAGELFGEKQHGALPVRLKHFWSKSLYQLAKKVALQIIETNPQQALSIASRLTTW